MARIQQKEPVRAAQQIIGDFIALRDEIATIAHGFAVLDFVQGRVAVELPTDTARSIVDVLRDGEPREQRAHLEDLVILWLENYRRAYSNLLVRVFENDADFLTA